MLPATAGDLRMKSVPRAFRPCCRYPQLPISSRTQALEDDKRLPESRAESRPGFSSPAQQSASSICSAETMVLEPARSHVQGDNRLRPSKINGRLMASCTRSQSRLRNSFHSVAIRSASQSCAASYASLVYSICGSIARALHGLGVVYLYVRAFRQQLVDLVDGRRKANIIRVRLEGQT